MSYVDGFVVPVPVKKVEAYRKMARKAGKVWIEHGALDYKECIFEDKKDYGMCLTFPKAFRSKKGETIFFSFIVYKNRKHRDAVNKKVMADPRLNDTCKDGKMPFDVKRMAYGGFKALVDIEK